MVGQLNQTTSSTSSSSSCSPCQPVSVSSSTTMSSGKSGGALVQSNSQEVPNRCVWCRDNKKQLPYVLPTQHGRKEVCSEICLVHFKMAYKAGNCTLCSECGCAVRSQDHVRKLAHKDKEQSFCSNECLEEYKKRHGIQVSPPTIVPPPVTVVTTAPPPPAATTTTTVVAAAAPPQQAVTLAQHSSKPPLLPATKKKQHDPNVSTDEFRWSDYLVKTTCKPAPAHCFKQHATPPKNEFANDMKLEAIDPRNTTSTCIATVIRSVGPRIRLRLDGSDNSNDFWRSVDSDEIQPIGTCEKNGGMLQPPLGFQKNASFWPMFLCKTLNGAQMAPSTCFKNEPPTPRFNLFKVGHKLEAVDRKNPQLICVATVGAVDRDNIHVTFDGWRGAFDYWCKYDSRDIFPVGWCELAGHPLQPPGNKPPLHGPTTPCVNASPQLQISSNHHDQPTSPQPQIPPYVATLHLNTICEPGPYLDPARVRSSPTMIGPSNIQEVYNQFIQILRHCALRASPLDTLLPVQGSDIHEQGDFWAEILGLIDRFKFCENFVSDKAEDEDDSGSVSSGGGGAVTRSGRVRECPKCGGGGLGQPGGGQVSGRNGDGKSGKKRKSSGGGKDRKVIEHDTLEQPVSKKSVQVVHHQQQQQQQHQKSLVDPGDWDVEQVIGAIVMVDKSMDNYAELFRKHEIDGKAMLLLNSEMMMRYMGLKLGPALKICNIISKFKSKYNIKNGGSNGV